MKCNIRELAHLSDKPCIIEGRLNYRKIWNGGYRNQSVFKERWFRLINNYLFYFKISEMGKFDTRNPAGVFVMENSSIQMEHGQSIPFSFSISFLDEVDKKHLFAARSEDNVAQWVVKLRECSYEYLRNQLHILQSKIYAITGKDPLLLVPRNEGACLWAPAIPFSTVPACNINTSSFSCHLHTNSAFTLERSKSDIQAHRYFNNGRSKKATIFTDDIVSKTRNISLERNNPQGTQEKSIFDIGPAYSRAAPSPPVRTKISKLEVNNEVKSLAEKGKFLGTTGILDEVPVPPRRRPSPRHTRAETVNILLSSGSDASQSQTNEPEDLIKF